LDAKEPCNPHILWDPEYTTLSYRGRNLALSRLQTGLNEIIADTWDRLLALTNNNKIKIMIPKCMSEDLRSTNTGGSFLDGATTHPPTLPLLFEMSKRSRLPLLRRDEYAYDDNTFKVDPGAAQEFFHTIKPIVEAITFLVHATGSGPLRLTEVVDDRHRNGSSQRNLFISHGSVFLLRRNLKPSTFRGYRSFVVHFPSPKVAELLVYYLVVVRPVEVFLAASLQWDEQLDAYSEFIYVVKGQKLTGTDLSGIIARYTDRYFDCRLTGLDLRHVLVNLQAVFLPPIPDPSAQKFRDSQAGHSTRVANKVYGQRKDHLPGEEADSFGLSFHWCKEFHTLLGLGPEDSPIRPIPYIHALPKPTWWSPSNYVAPRPSSLDEVMVRAHLIINSTLSSCTQMLSERCDKVIREAVFQGLAASSLLAAPDQPSISRPPAPAPDELQVLPSMPGTVSF
jgi:hypothetical protein